MDVPDTRLAEHGPRLYHTLPPILWKEPDWSHTVFCEGVFRSEFSLRWGLDRSQHLIEGCDTHSKILIQRDHIHRLRFTITGKDSRSLTCVISTRNSPERKRKRTGRLGLLPQTISKRSGSRKGKGRNNVEFRLAEDRDSGADAQRKRHGGGQREDGITDEEPRGVTEIAPGVLQPREGTGVARELLRRLRAPKRQTRLSTSHLLLKQFDDGLT